MASLALLMETWLDIAFKCPFCCSVVTLLEHFGFVSQVEEEKEKKRLAKIEERAQKRKKEKEAASKETEPKAKKARQVKQ